MKRMNMPLETFAWHHPVTRGVRLPTSGPRFGTYEDGTPWLHYPPLQKRDGILSSTVTATVANIEGGKTTQAMAEVMRWPFITFGRPGIGRWASDVMRANGGICEWDLVAQWYRTTSVLLHEFQFNHLDPALGIGYNATVGYTVDMCQQGKLPPLGDNELTVLGAALGKIFENPMLRQAADYKMLGEIIAASGAEDGRRYLANAFGIEQTPTSSPVAFADGTLDTTATHPRIDPQKFDPFISEEDFRRAATVVLMRLARILKSGIFGSKSSLPEAMKQKAGVFYLGDIDDQYIPLVQSLIWMVRDANAADPDSPYHVLYEQHDENYQLMQLDPRYVERQHWRVKTARAFDTSIHFMIHLLDEFISVGAADSPERNMALKIIKHVGQWLIGKQEYDALPFIRDFFGLPREMVKRLPTLGVGEFLLLRGKDSPAFVKYKATPAEKLVSPTNIANLRHLGEAPPSLTSLTPGT